MAAKNSPRMQDLRESHGESRMNQNPKIKLKPLKKLKGKKIKETPERQGVCSMKPCSDEFEGSKGGGKARMESPELTQNSTKAKTTE